MGGVGRGVDATGEIGRIQKAREGANARELAAGEVVVLARQRAEDALRIGCRELGSGQRARARHLEALRLDGIARVGLGPPDDVGAQAVGAGVPVECGAALQGQVEHEQLDQRGRREGLDFSANGHGDATRSAALVCSSACSSTEDLLKGGGDAHDASWLVVLAPVLAQHGHRCGGAWWRPGEGQVAALLLQERIDCVGLGTGGAMQLQRPVARLVVQALGDVLLIAVAELGRP